MSPPQVDAAAASAAAVTTPGSIRCDSVLPTPVDEHERNPALLPNPPSDGPLFVYDALKPHDIAFPKIAALVSYRAARAEGYALRSRDGLPLLLGVDGGYVDGYLLDFPDTCRVYKAVREYEPAKQYRWACHGILVQASGETVLANALLARKPEAGADQEHIHLWSSWQDPVFSRAVSAAASIAQPFLTRSAADGGDPWGALFRLQAAYLLLWSAVERFTALRFGPALPPVERLRRIPEMPAWPQLIRQADVRVTERRIVDSRDPAARITIGQDGANAWKYWYQVRSNLSHRGKGAHRDRDIVAEAFIDVHDVFRLLMLDAMPDVQQAWRQIEPDGADRQWRLRPLLE